MYGFGLYGFVFELKLNKTMKETKFRVLMHTGQYIDTNLLEKGIYSTSTPTLYSKDTTIKMIEDQGRLMKDMTGNLFISERWFENLRKCNLVYVSLTGVFDH